MIDKDKRHTAKCCVSLLTYAINVTMTPFNFNDFGECSQ